MMRRSACRVQRKNSIMAIGKLKKIPRIIAKTKRNPKAVKQSVEVNPYAKIMPKTLAKRKFQQRPMRKSVTGGQQPLTKRERIDKPLRTARSRYGGR